MVTAIVVSWNTRALLARCLDALAGDDRLDVHVVDNGSTDGSRDLVVERAGVTLHAPDANLGYGAAIELVVAATDPRRGGAANDAASGAAGSWLLLLNADVALRPGAVDALLDAAARDPGAGAFAPRLVLPDGSDQHSAYPFPTLPFLAAFDAGVSRSPFREGHFDARIARRVPWAVAACLLVRRAAFEDAGGFDPDLWLYAEDLDLGWRLRRAGWATRHVPDAVADHASAASTSQAWGDARTVRWQAATYAWIARRRGPVRARAAYALNLAGAAARARLAREGWQRDRARVWAATHRAAWRSRPATLPRR